MHLVVYIKMPVIVVYRKKHESMSDMFKLSLFFYLHAPNKLLHEVGVNAGLFIMDSY